MDELSPRCRKHDRVRDLSPARSACRVRRYKYHWLAIHSHRSYVARTDLFPFEWIHSEDRRTLYLYPHGLW